MPFNGSGSFVPIASPDFPAVAGTTIRSAQFNAVINDLMNGLSEVQTRNGQAPATGNWSMGGFKLTNLGAPTASSDALTRSMVEKAVTPIASAGVLPIPAEGGLFEVTGTTTITQLSGSFAGRVIALRFGSALTLQAGTNLILPGGRDLATAAGVVLTFICIDGTKWQVATNFYETLAIGSAGWAVVADGTTLKFFFNSTLVATLSSAGIFTAKGDVIRDTSL